MKKSKIGLTTGSMMSLFTFAVGLTIISPLLSSISKDFNFPVSSSGILFTANFLGFIIFNTVFSFFINRIDMRIALIAFTIGYSVFVYLFTITSSFYMLLLCMTIMGGFGGLIESISGTLIVEINNGREGFYMNFSQIFFGIGALIGPLCAGYMDEIGISWRVMFIITTVIGVISALLLIIFDYERHTKSENISIADIKKMFSMREFKTLMVGMMLYVGAEISAWGWISTLLKAQFNISSFKSSFSVGLFWAFMIIGRIITAKLTDRLSMKKIIMYLCGAGAIFTFLSAIVKSELVIWILIALIGLTYSGIWPTIVALAGKISDKHSSTAYLLIIASGGVGGMIFPYLIGIFGQAVSISITLSIISVMVFCINILLYFSKEI